jgi:hypothetical protein
MEFRISLLERRFIEIRTNHPANGQVERFVRNVTGQENWNGTIHSYNPYLIPDQGEEFIIEEGQIISRHQIPELPFGEAEGLFNFF